MILSYVIGRRRVARGERPSWLAAWGLVMLDAAIVIPLFAAVGFAVSTYLYSRSPMHWSVLWSLVVTFFVPTQGSLVLSSLWAAQSRWQDRPEKEAER